MVTNSDTTQHFVEDRVNEHTQDTHPSLDNVVKDHQNPPPVYEDMSCEEADIPIMVPQVSKTPEDGIFGETTQYDLP